MKGLCVVVCLILAGSLYSQIPVSGLVSHYTFNRSIQDNTANGNNGISTEDLISASDRFGNSCGALNFNGKSSLRIPSSQSLKSLTYSMAVTVWIQLDKPASNSSNLLISLFSKGDLTDMQYGLQVTRNFGDPYSDILVSGINSFRDNNYNSHPIEFDKWHFIALSFEDNWMQLYLDGKLAWQGMNNKSFIANDADLIIGKFGNNFIKGKMDDFRIYNRSLSNAEIAALFTDESSRNTPDKITINVSGNIEKNTDKGKCSAHITFPNPQATAACSQVVIKQIIGLENGALFPLGENTITYEAISTSGSKDMKSFVVKIFDNEPPSVKCPDNVFSKSTKKEGARIVYKTPVTSDNCKEVKLNLLSGLKSGELFPLGTTEVKYEVVDSSGNKSFCSFSVTIELDTPPLTAKAITEPVSIDTIEIKKNQEKSNVNPNAVTQLQNEKRPDLSLTEKTTERITPTKPLGDSIAFKSAKNVPIPIKSDTIKSSNSNVAGINHALSTINSTQETTKKIPQKIERELILPIKNEAILSSNPSSLTAPKKFSGIDKVETNITRTQIPSVAAPNNDVKVLDVPKENTKPGINKKTPKDTKWEITFIHDVVQKNDAGKCGAIVNYTAPKIEGQSGLKPQLKSGSPSGSFFPLGTTRNLFSAQDEYVRIKESAFNVVIKDTEPPRFNCPGDTVILLPQNRRGIMYFYDPPSCFDNCEIDSISQTLGSKNGCFLQIGVHPFTFRATDKSGNTQLCAYSVIVKDDLVTAKNDTSTPLEVIPQRLSPLLNIGKDSIKYEHKIDVTGCVLTALFYDDGEEDNDSVSIIFNGQVIVTKTKIKLKENGYIKRVLHLTEDTPNYVIAKAWNTGKYGLNTLKMEVYEGDFEDTDKREFKNMKPIFSKVLHSKPGNAGGMILNCQ